MTMVITHTPDPVDAASLLTDAINEDAVRNRVRPPEPIPDNVQLTAVDLECEDCLEPMPELRRRNGYLRCVPCQEIRDAKDKRHLH